MFLSDSKLVLSMILLASNEIVWNPRNPLKSLPGSCSSYHMSYEGVIGLVSVVCTFVYFGQTVKPGGLSYRFSLNSSLCFMDSSSSVISFSIFTTIESVIPLFSLIALDQAAPEVLILKLFSSLRKNQSPCRKELPLARCP